MRAPRPRSPPPTRGPHNHNLHRARSRSSSANLTDSTASRPTPRTRALRPRSLPRSAVPRTRSPRETRAGFASPAAPSATTAIAAEPRPQPARVLRPPRAASRPCPLPAAMPPLPVAPPRQAGRARRARRRPVRRSERRRPFSTTQNPTRARPSARAGRRPIFGHETAFWHGAGETPFRRNPATWGFPSRKASRASKTARNRPRTCQNAVSWPKSRDLAARMPAPRVTGGREQSPSGRQEPRPKRRARIVRARKRPRPHASSARTAPLPATQRAARGPHLQTAFHPVPAARASRRPQRSPPTTRHFARTRNASASMPLRQPQRSPPATPADSFTLPCGPCPPSRAPLQPIPPSASRRPQRAATRIPQIALSQRAQLAHVPPPAAPRIPQPPHPVPAHIPPQRASPAHPAAHQPTVPHLAAEPAAASTPAHPAVGALHASRADEAAYARPPPVSPPARSRAFAFSRSPIDGSAPLGYMLSKANSRCPEPAGISTRQEAA